MIPNGAIIMLLSDIIYENSDLDRWYKVKILCPSNNIGWILFHDLVTSANSTLKLLK